MKCRHKWLLVSHTDTFNVDWCPVCGAIKTAVIFSNPIVRRPKAVRVEARKAL